MYRGVSGWGKGRGATCYWSGPLLQEVKFIMKGILKDSGTYHAIWKRIA